MSDRTSPRESAFRPLQRLQAVFWTLLLFITMLGLADVLLSRLGTVFLQILLSVAMSAVLLSAVAGVTAGRRTLPVRVIQTMVALALLLKFLQLVDGGGWWRVSFAAVSALCIAYTAVEMLRFLLRTQRADLDTISGAVSVYLLMAIGWALVFSIQSHFDPQAFKGMEAAGASAADHTISFTGLYYSLVTVTTLGYGDITPVSALTRLTSALAALSGQIVLVVLIARVVSLSTAPSDDR